MDHHSSKSWLRHCRHLLPVPPPRHLPATPSSEDQPMAHVNYEHLTIFEEHEFYLHTQVFAVLIIVTKFPQCPHIQVEVPRSVSHRKVLRVVRENTSVELPLENVLRLFGEYVLLTRSFKEATCIMGCPYMHVENHILAILGWTPDYGSTTFIHG